MTVQTVEIGQVRSHTVEVVGQPTYTVEVGTSAVREVVEVGGIPLEAISPTSVVETAQPAHVIEVLTTSASELVEVGVIGPPGPQGEPGPTSTGGTQWWVGDGVPEVVVGAEPGDIYLDRTTGTYYELT